MKVLLTNDDGLQAPGLRALYHALKKRGHEVFAIAPNRQQSGTARSVTVFSPILVEKVEEPDFRGIGVAGTPADCVKLGLGRLCPFQPDLVISGINQGPNAGPDIHYSGTVGAAAEAASAGVPAIAVSRMGHEIQEDGQDVASHLVELAEKLDWNGIKPGIVINVNYPSVPVREAKGVRACAQSQLQWPNDYSESHDPRGNSYWWFASQLDESKYGADTDRELLSRDFITVSPLKFDYTDYQAISGLEAMLAK